MTDDWSLIFGGIMLVMTICYATAIVGMIILASRNGSHNIDDHK